MGIHLHLQAEGGGGKGVTEKVKNPEKCGINQ